MILSRLIKIQATVFTVVAVIAATVMAVCYMRLPQTVFGVGYYAVRLELPQAGGLYKNGNVTYRGTEVGRVTEVRLTDSGVEAVLALKSSVPIPADLDAQVHSQMAIGEQYVALLPRTADAPPLADGDVIPLARTSVPPDINTLLDSVNRGVQAIPHDSLRTVIDESYTAFGGLGPQLSRLVKGASSLAIDARRDLDSLTTLIDTAPPLLEAQAQTSGAVQAWAAHLAEVTAQLKSNDDAVAGVLDNGGAAAAEARELMDRLNPTLPIVLANLAGVGNVALTYQAGIEQMLVLLPQGVAMMQGIGVPNRNVNGLLHGAPFLDFNMNMGIPPVCTTGFLPARQMRNATFEDYPDRPAGDLYCRIPQDSPWYVRGARNIPCETKPGKRAPTAVMCESDEQYVPLNEGFNWKGDPNATFTGQDVPQLRPDSAPPATVGAPPAIGAAVPPAEAPQPAPDTPPGPPPPGPPPPGPAPPIVATHYDPLTGTYLGPDGRVYTQADLAHNAVQEKTWQSMLMPPMGK